MLKGIFILITKGGYVEGDIHSDHKSVLKLQ